MRCRNIALVGSDWSNSCTGRLTSDIEDRCPLKNKAVWDSDSVWRSWSGQSPRPCRIQMSDHQVVNEHQTGHFAELAGGLRKCMGFLFLTSIFLLAHSTLRHKHIHSTLRTPEKTSEKSANGLQWLSDILFRGHSMSGQTVCYNK